MSPLIVVSFALIASLVVPLFPVQYSPSTQNEHRVVQNRAFDYRLLLVASSCRNPLTDEVHSVRSQGRSARLSIATKNQPFSQGGWKGVAELVVGFERKLGCLFLSIVPTRLPIFHEGSCDTIARSSARFHGCRS